MVRPLSNDLRKRVVSALAKGESCRSVAVRFGVAVASVVRWWQRYRKTGSVKPGQMGGASQAGAGAAWRLHQGADQADAAFDAAWAQGRTGDARHPCLAQRGVAVHAPRGAALQKKRCSRLSRAAPMSPAGVGAGDHGRPGLIRAGWSSLMRPGSKPTWPRCADGVTRGSACGALRRMAVGAR